MFFVDKQKKRNSTFWLKKKALSGATVVETDYKVLLMSTHNICF